MSARVPSPRVGDQGHRRFDARHLGGVDVDVDDLEVGVRVRPAEPLQFQARTDADEHVGFGPALVTGRAGEAQGIVVRDDPAAAAPGYDRRLQRSRELAHLGRGVLRAAAHHDHGITGGGEHPGRLGDQVGIRLRRGVGGRRNGQVDGRTLREHVPRHLDGDRPGPTGGHLAKRLGHGRRRLGRVVDAGGPFRDGAQGRQLIGQLVQVAHSAADEVRGHLARDAHHRRARPIRGTQSRARIQHPGTRDHGKDAVPPGRLGVAEGHVRGRLLVAGVNHPEPVLGLLHGIKQPVGLHPGNSEHGIHAVREQACDNGLTARHRFRHCMTSGKTVALLGLRASRGVIR